MDRLQAIYADYFKKAADARSKASPFAGVWGMGDDPRKDHCHDAFYEAVGAWVQGFDSQDPEAVLEAVRYILEAADSHRDEDVYWYLYAAQGLVMPLISRIRAEDCKALAQWYDKRYPKRHRLPVQQSLFKALKKAGK